MEVTLKKQRLSAIHFFTASLLGAGLITLCGLIKIPFYPIPFTLQGFAIILLGLTQRPSQAFSSCVTYLLAVTAGLPVLNGGVANALWFTGPTCGYLVAFPCAAFLVSFLKTRVNPLIASLTGQVLIWAGGFAWLSYLFGPTIAWNKGVLIFIASDTLKTLGAFGTLKLKKWIK